MEGWPNKKDQMKDDLKYYYKYREEISVINKLLYKGYKVIVPKSLRQKYLEIAHYSHSGINKTIALANKSFFWPKMNAAIEQMTANCEICQRYQPSQPPETMISHEIKPISWYKVGCDIFHVCGKSFLLCVDYYSKFFEVIDLNNDLTSNNVVNKLKEIFCRQGIPNVLCSDNGPEFSALNFKKFAKEYQFSHVTSSPRYPQSNGQVESMVKSIKSTIKKCLADRKDPYLALIALKNTPVNNTSFTPANILLNRDLKDLLPRINDRYRQKNKVQINYNKQIKKGQIAQQKYYNKKNKRCYKKFKLNEEIVVQNVNTKEWERGRIVEKVGIRAYKLLLYKNDRLLVRNRKFIRTFKSSTVISRDNKQTNVKTSNDQHNDQEGIRLSQLYYFNNKKNTRDTGDQPTTITHESGATTSTDAHVHLKGPKKVVNNNTQVQTRSGRIVKRPEKLKL